MSAIIENLPRIGNFTSSEIHSLMKNGKGPGGIGAPAVTYIEEKNMERRMGRSVDTDSYSRDMAWGSFLEKRVFDMLGFEYQLLSNETDLHPTIACWAGSKDLLVPSVKIGEIKCYQPKKFCQYTDAIMAQDIARIREDFPKEYWQAISNGIINKVPNVELITYMPFLSELPELREMAENYDGADQWKYRFIAESEDAALAYLPDGGYYNNLNRFEFAMPAEDVEALTERILFCETLLIER